MLRLVSALRASKPVLALLPTLVAGSLAAVCSPSRAFPIDAGNEEVKLRWDNTFKYSAAGRLKNRSSVIMQDYNTDDGDQNFGKGLISNRFDILSEFDATYRNFGGRLSAAAWYDTVYNHSNDNNSPGTSNVVSVAHNEFTQATRDRMGRKAELMDAFVFAKGRLGDMAGTVRVGRHSLVFGESIFFGGNGIANAQGPIDLVKQLNVPSSQFKEILRPVNQVSGQLQVTSNVSVGAYYQFKWEKSILPPSGSYLSASDIAGEGAERAGPWTRGRDLKARNSGQGGLQLRYSAGETEYGLYAARYHEKAPQIYLASDTTTPPAFFAPRDLVHAYPEGIRTFGVSMNTALGPVNVAGEASIRHNAPLTSDPVLTQFGGGADNGTNAAYAIGKTAHMQISGIYLLKASPFWQGGSLIGELAWNRTLSIARNRAALDANTTRDAYAFRVVFAPSYFQVLPGLDLTVPIGLGFNPRGRSSAVYGFNGGVEHGGDFSLGVNGTYDNVWQFGLNFVKFLGKESPLVTPPNDPGQRLSFRQALKDRDFISLNVKRSF